MVPQEVPVGYSLIKYDELMIISMVFILSINNNNNNTSQCDPAYAGSGEIRV